MKKELNFGTLHFFDHYIVSHINEGETITTEKNNIIAKCANDYYGDSPFAYISHRINSYAVDTSTYSQTSKIHNLIGFAVVSKDYKAKSNAEIEKLFLNKPFEIFKTIEEAVAWVESLFKN